jgi:hypothetical protein
MGPSASDSTLEEAIMKTLIGALSLCIASLSGACFAQQEPPAALARSVAPYVDGQTLAVAHADLAAIDAGAAVEVLARFMNVPPKERDRMLALVVPINVFADTLPEGARADMFVVSSASDLSSLPLFLVLPLEGSAPAAAISLEVRRAVAKELGAKAVTEPLGEALVTGSERTIARLRKAQPLDRPEVAAALEAVGDSPLHVLLIPSADAWRVLELVMPKLPAELGGRATRGMSQAVRWVAVGLDFSDAGTDVKVVVQATSPESAATLAEEFKAVVASLAQHAPAERREGLDALAQRLGPQVAGDRLELAVTATGDEVAQLGQLLAPLLATAERALAQRFPARRANE